MFGIGFIKAQPTTHLIQYRGGQVVREGAGLSFFYYAPTTSLVAVPVASQNEGFIYQLLTRDFQGVTVQGQVAYRVAEPRKTAALLNFALKPDAKDYTSDDPEKLPARVLALVEVLTQQAVRALTLKEALLAAEAVSRQANQPKAAAAAVSAISAVRTSMLRSKSASSRGTGGRCISLPLAGSITRFTVSVPSVTMLIHRICTAASGSG